MIIHFYIKLGNFTKKNEKNEKKKKNDEFQNLLFKIRFERPLAA